MPLTYYYRQNSIINFPKFSWINSFKFLKLIFFTIIMNDHHIIIHTKKNNSYLPLDI